MRSFLLLLELFVASALFLLARGLGDAELVQIGLFAVLYVVFAQHHGVGRARE